LNPRRRVRTAAATFIPIALANGWTACTAPRTFWLTVIVDS
jgi:hypothetical protein